MKKALILLFFVPFFFWGCPEIEEVSPVPHIEFQKFIINTELDSLGNRMPVGYLSFNFIDGDADLGVLKSVDTNLALPDSVKHGIFIDFFEKKNGIYIRYYPTQLVTKTVKIVRPDTSFFMDSVYVDTISFNKYLPYDEKLNRVGQNKIVKGVIRVKLPFEKDPEKDSMRFEFYIRDRALNKSNVEVTPDFSKYDLYPNQ